MGALVGRHQQCPPAVPRTVAGARQRVEGFSPARCPCRAPPTVPTRTQTASMKVSRPLSALARHRRRLVGRLRLFTEVAAPAPKPKGKGPKR